MSSLKKMMRELHMSRRHARSLLHVFKVLESLNKRKLRAALARRKKRTVDVELFDVHRDTAAHMLHKKSEDVNDAERRLAKTMNFGIMFGGFRDV